MCSFHKKYSTIDCLRKKDGEVENDNHVQSRYNGSGLHFLSINPSEEASATHREVGPHATEDAPATNQIEFSKSPNPEQELIRYAHINENSILFAA